MPSFVKQINSGPRLAKKDTGETLLISHRQGLNQRQGGDRLRERSSVFRFTAVGSPVEVELEQSGAELSSLPPGLLFLPPDFRL